MAFKQQITSTAAHTHVYTHENELCMSPMSMVYTSTLLWLFWLATSAQSTSGVAQPHALVVCAYAKKLWLHVPIDRILAKQACGDGCMPTQDFNLQLLFVAIRVVFVSPTPSAELMIWASKWSSWPGEKEEEEEKLHYFPWRRNYKWLLQRHQSMDDRRVGQNIRPAKCTQPSALTCDGCTWRIAVKHTLYLGIRQAKLGACVINGTIWFFVVTEITELQSVCCPLTTCRCNCSRVQ